MKVRVGRRTALSPTSWNSVTRVEENTLLSHTCTVQHSTAQYSIGAPHLLLLPRGVGDHHPVWGVAGEDDGEVCEGGHGAAAHHSSLSDYLLSTVPQHAQEHHAPVPSSKPADFFEDVLKGCSLFVRSNS